MERIHLQADNRSFPGSSAGARTGHTHEGPVFVYILNGEIESQVDPNPPEIYRSDEFFYEAPGQLHRFLRNWSKTESATLLTFQTGYTGRSYRDLLHMDLLATADQEVRLLRLTVPSGASEKITANANSDAFYILEGKIEASTGTSLPKAYGAGDVFVKPAGRTGIEVRNERKRVREIASISSSVWKERIAMTRNEWNRRTVLVLTTFCMLGGSGLPLHGQSSHLARIRMVPLPVSYM